MPRNSGEQEMTFLALLPLDYSNINVGVKVLPLVPVSIVLLSNDCDSQPQLSKRPEMIGRGLDNSIRNSWKLLLICHKDYYPLDHNAECYCTSPRTSISTGFRSSQTFLLPTLLCYGYFRGK